MSFLCQQPNTDEIEGCITSRECLTKKIKEVGMDRMDGFRFKARNRVLRVNAQANVATQKLDLVVFTTCSESLSMSQQKNLSV